MKKSIEILKLVCLAGIVLLSLFKVQAQHETDYTIQASIIYRFTKYINWPANKKSGDFIIGVVEDAPLYEDLKTFMDNKTVDNQKIVVTKLPASASYDNCNIIFISKEKSGQLKRIAALTASSPVLIITEYNGLAHKGSCINFITLNNRLKIEINKTNADQRSLHIASELLDLAIIVK